MTLETFGYCFQGIINACWHVLSEKIILNNYSLWNVFQGVFACWCFKIVIIDGILNIKKTGVQYNPKSSKFYYNSKGDLKAYKE